MCQMKHDYRIFRCDYCQEDTIHYIEDGVCRCMAHEFEEERLIREGALSIIEHIVSSVEDLS